MQSAPTTTATPSSALLGDTALVERWLEARRTLITSYCSVSSTLNQDHCGALLRKRLGSFLDQLVDYVSAGHFEVYGELLASVDSSKTRVCDLMGQLYPRIEASTELALAFDEQCAAAHSDPATLMTELSRLGEVMESRFAGEDQLISLVRNERQTLAA